MFLFFVVIALLHVVVLVVLVSLLLLLSTGSGARFISLFYVDVLPFSGTSHLVGRIMGKLLPNMINSPSCTSTKQPIYVCFIWIYVLLYDLYSIYMALNMTQTTAFGLNMRIYCGALGIVSRKGTTLPMNEFFKFALHWLILNSAMLDC